MKHKDFKSLCGLFEVFPDEQSCIEFLEAHRWANGVVSPFDKDSKGQLARDIGVTQKTAWFMLHRIRNAFDMLKGLFGDCVL